MHGVKAQGSDPLRCGGVPEWLKGTDCKSVGFAYAGSNPAPSTIFMTFSLVIVITHLLSPLANQFLGLATISFQLFPRGVGQTPLPHAAQPDWLPCYMQGRREANRRGQH